MGVYDPLGTYLAMQTDPVIKMTFGEVERVLARPLPPSARKHNAWWANEVSGRHTNARSWLGAHRKTRNLDLNAATVEFVK